MALSAWLTYAYDWVIIRTSGPFVLEMGAFHSYNPIRFFEEWMEPIVLLIIILLVTVELGLTFKDYKVKVNESS